MRKRTRERKTRQGFTLTEMLIVLGILVMLLALVVPRLLGTRDKADQQSAEAQVQLLRGALELYNVHTRTFPSTEQGLAALLQQPADAEENSVKNWDGPYLSQNELPTDPWGNEYQYAYPPERGTGDFPDIWSLGPDGEDETDDDICSWGTGTSEEGEFGTEPKEDLDIDVDMTPPRTEES